MEIDKQAAVKLAGEGGAWIAIIYMLWAMNSRLGEISAKLDWIFQWAAQSN